MQMRWNTSAGPYPYPQIEPLVNFLPTYSERTAPSSWALLLWDQDRFQNTYSHETDTTNTTPNASRPRIMQTDAGPIGPQRRKALEALVIAPSFRARDGVFELRRLTGLTWDELAELLSVTRRTVHLWANGAPINTPNEKRVRDMLVTMRKLDRGTARENRSLLIAPQPEGGIFSDLLRGQRFEEALALGRLGRGRPVSAETSAKKKQGIKLSVADMLGSSADRIHSDKGGSLAPRRRPRRP